MRTGEVCALTWDDINSILLKVLTNYKNKQNCNKRKYGSSYKVYHLEDIKNEHGIKKCRCYDLRGSYAIQVLRNGAEIRDVADILGHSKIETTENYYISSTEESRKEANYILEKIIQTDVINEIMNYKF